MKRTVVMYTPTAQGGHALYSKEVLEALAGLESDELQFELLTSVDLGDEYRSERYMINAVLPRLRHKSEFGLSISWALSRVSHYLMRELRLLLWLISRPDVAVLHIQEISPWFGAPVLFLVRKILKVRICMTVHNIVPHKYPEIIPKAAFDWLLRAVHKQCRVLFVHANTLAEDLSDREGIARDSVLVARHGVWSSTLRLGAEDVGSLRVMKGRPTILFYGTIRRNKGLHFLLDAMERLPDDYRLIIAGEVVDPPYFDEVVRPLLDMTEMSGRVDFRRGFVPDEDVPELFSEADVIALPYAEFSAQSGILFDAIAHSLPVVCTNAGAVGETVGEYCLGTVVEDLSPDGLASGIVATVEGLEDLRSNFANAKNELSWRRHAEMLVAGYIG